MYIMVTYFIFNKIIQVIITYRKIFKKKHYIHVATNNYGAFMRVKYSLFLHTNTIKVINSQ